VTDWEGAKERIEAAFADNFSRGEEVGSAVTVWRNGEEMASFCGGFCDAARKSPWTRNTLVLIWSATKGLSSACVLHALAVAGRDLGALVSEIWPEFTGDGKERLTVGEVLSHQSGLSAVSDRSASFLDHEAVIRAIENQAPYWESGDGHGYGPRTYGFLADELVRRLSGRKLGDYWREEFGQPMELDVWLGLPEAEHGRVAQILAARTVPSARDPFAQALAVPDSLTRAAFSSPPATLSPSAMNAPAMRSAGFPSLGGIGSAEALAKFYAMLACGGTWEGRRYFSEESLRAMTTPLTQGLDRTLCTETAFSAGFMMDPVEPSGKKIRALFGPSATAFGHPGAGGSLAFADPEKGIGFAYVMNQMEAGVLPQKRALSLVEALYGKIS